MIVVVVVTTQQLEPWPQPLHIWSKTHPSMDQALFSSTEIHHLEACCRIVNANVSVWTSAQPATDKKTIISQQQRFAALPLLESSSRSENKTQYIAAVSTYLRQHLLWHHVHNRPRNGTVFGRHHQRESFSKREIPIMCVCLGGGGW